MRFLSRTRTLNALFPVGQHFFHVSFSALQCLNVCFDTLELVLGKLVHATAWSTPGITSFQDFSQLSQSESDPECPLHDKNSLQRARRIDSVTRLCSRGSWQNADPFIVSNRVWTHRRCPGESPRIKGFGTSALHHSNYQAWNAFQSQDVWRHGVAPIPCLLACARELLILEWCHNAPQWSPYCQSLQPPRFTAFVGFKQSRLSG